MKKKKFQVEECECGDLIRGVTENQLRHNMKTHKESRRHKTNMELKKNKRKND